MSPSNAANPAKDSSGFVARRMDADSDSATPALPAGFAPAHADHTLARLFMLAYHHCSVQGDQRSVSCTSRRRPAAREKFLLVTRFERRR